MKHDLVHRPRMHGKTQAYVETLAMQMLIGTDVAALPPDATPSERRRSREAVVVVIGRGAREIVDRASAHAARLRREGGGQ